MATLFEMKVTPKKNIDRNRSKTMNDINYEKKITPLIQGNANGSKVSTENIMSKVFEKTRRSIHEGSDYPTTTTSTLRNSSTNIEKIETQTSSSGGNSASSSNYSPESDKRFSRKNKNGRKVGSDDYSLKKSSKPFTKEKRLSDQKMLLEVLSSPRFMRRNVDNNKINSADN